jgi:hypothetical protein
VEATRIGKLRLSVFRAGTAQQGVAGFVIAMSRELRIKAKLEELGFPVIAGYMNKNGGLMFRCSDEWMAHYRWLTGVGTLSPWPIFRNHGRTATASARERVAWNSCHVTLHTISGELWAEADIDHGNPGMGAIPAIVHLAVDGLGFGLYRRLRKPWRNQSRAAA